MLQQKSKVQQLKPSYVVASIIMLIVFCVGGLKVFIATILFGVGTYVVIELWLDSYSH